MDYLKALDISKCIASGMLIDIRIWWRSDNMDVPDKPLSESPHGFCGVLILITLAGIVTYFKA